MQNINIEQYKSTDINIHKAVQIIAFLGKQLGENKADDSQTTSTYQSAENALVGQPLTINQHSYTARLDLADFQIKVAGQQRVLPFVINQRTATAVVQEIKEQLEIKDLANFKLHYDLPDSYQISQAIIEAPSANSLQDWATVRDLANRVLENLNTIIQPTSPVNIWPHHFDTGTYHVLTSDAKGGSASIGTGFAMADTMIEKPYFYIYGWSRDKVIDFSAAPKLTLGEWKTGEWKGAVVPLSALQNLTNPEDKLAVFFTTTVHFFTSQI